MLSSKCNSKLVKRYYFWKVSNFWKCFQSRLSVQLLAKFTRQKFIPLHRVFFLLVPHPAQGDLLYISLHKGNWLATVMNHSTLDLSSPPRWSQEGQKWSSPSLLEAEVLSCKNKSIHGKFQVGIFCFVFFWNSLCKDVPPPSEKNRRSVHRLFCIN